MTPDLGPPRLLVIAAQAAIVLLLAFETWLLARFLSWRAGEARPGFARRTWLLLALLAAVFAIPAGLLARSGALAPGVSGAGMPWERTTDHTPILAAAQAGQRAYMNRCAPCHLPEGTGLPPAYPALTESPVLRGPIAAHARVALWGSEGLDAGGAHVHMHAHVPGRAHMPAFAGAASNEELAAILTYERLAFAVPGRVPARDGGDADSLRHHVRPSDVARVRAEGPPR
jgi:mono/diheme cytochrome c family protein